MLEPVSVSLESLNLGTLTPMLIAIFGALLILIVDLIKSDTDKSLHIILTLLILLIDLGAVASLTLNQRGFFDVMLIDGIGVLSQMIIIVASLLFIPLAFAGKKFHEYQYPEYFAMFLFMIAGFQFMVSTDNLILIFVGLETSSFALYTMIAMHNRERSFEAAVKYFTMGALSAGFYAFGAMILYAVSGSVEIGEIAEVMAAREYEPILYILVGMIFMLASFGFKLGLVPFHTWVPDVYEGSTSALAGYMSIVPKIAALVVSIRLFEFLINSGIVWLEYMLYAIVVITMTIGNIWALVQTDVKRMLGYSSISHAGFVMAAVLIGTTQSNSAIFIYWILFLFTNLGAFSMLWINRTKVDEDSMSDHSYERYQGLFRSNPFAALMMGLFMLSLAGIPPFALFWGKLYLISSAVSANYIVLAIILALNSAIAAYYYLKLIIAMFLKDPLVGIQKNYLDNQSTALNVVVGISGIFMLVSIFFVDSIITTVTEYISMSGF